MRAVIQRVSSASVTVEDRVVGAIGSGALVLVGVATNDTEADSAWLADRIARQRIFDDATGRMDLSLATTGRELLVVSQFTLLASTRKGTKPSWHRAAPPDVAEPRYNEFVRTLETLLGRRVATGKFGAMMQVTLVNDGPVTLLLDSRLRE
jgi:D-aminoacyl-tRNA deacylase